MSRWNYLYLGLRILFWGALLVGGIILIAPRLVDGSPFAVKISVATAPEKPVCRDGYVGLVSRAGDTLCVQGYDPDPEPKQ